MNIRSVLACLVLVGCSSSNQWTAADTKAATTMLRTQQSLLALCQGDAGCTSDQVQIVETAAECNLGSMMARHGADVLDGGGAIGCQPTNP